MQTELFRKLEPHEEQAFKTYAHKHWVFDIKPENVWHPIVRKEWETMQELAETIVRVYKGLEPDITKDPISSDAHVATKNVLAFILDDYNTWDTINTEHFALWEILPREVQEKIIWQATAQYFQ